MANLKLRDRDGIVTKDSLVFRVFGYSHPPEAHVCDVEYANADIFKSSNPKAPRGNEQVTFYKFYEDEGWKFVRNRFPQYILHHEVLNKKIVAVHDRDILFVRKPEEELRSLIKTESKDQLLTATQTVINFVTKDSGLLSKNFGVFGSLLHGFHHPFFSDIDLVIYGKRNLAKLFETLQKLYSTVSSQFQNEFETDQSVSDKHWKFQNYSLGDYIQHQKRKMIYALFNDKKSGRLIKTEFEPIKAWNEINNEYDSEARISQLGWIKMTARVKADDDAPFIPSIYEVEPLEILKGKREAIEAKRIVSYVEEFRMQAAKDQIICVEGNLEKVTTRKETFYQIALTYCPEYYRQVIKTVT